jgi:hypothetical protein
MKHTVLLASLVLYCAAISASVPNPRAAYVSGSAAIPNGTEGSLNLEDSRELRFNYEGGTFQLPYVRITSMEVGDKPGVKAHLAVAVSWIPKVGKKHGKLLTIAFKNESGAGEAAIFEIWKSEYQTIAPVLEARTGKHVKVEDADEPQNAAKQSPTAQPEPAVGTLVPVTVTSTPVGATVSFWGQVAGRTPVTTKLVPGVYTMQIAASGLGSWTGDVSVEPGKPMTVSADLSQAGSPTVAAVR